MMPTSKTQLLKKHLLNCDYSTHVFIAFSLGKVREVVPQNDMVEPHWYQMIRDHQFLVRDSLRGFVPWSICRAQIRKCVSGLHSFPYQFDWNTRFLGWLLCIGWIDFLQKNENLNENKIFKIISQGKKVLQDQCTWQVHIFKDQRKKSK